MMTERREIVRRWERGAAGVLVTLVEVTGSSYRRPGARLLLTDGGVAGADASGALSVGSISGGCLEADLVRRAGWMVRAGAVVEQYSTAFDDTAEIPFGLGCGGELRCLLEPAGTAECEALMEAMRSSIAGEAVRVVTRLPGEGNGLARVVVGVDAAVRFRSAEIDAGLEAEMVAMAVSAGLTAGETPPEGFFVERMEPPQRLWVMGAGEDARPLVRVASLLGWSVVVADGRVPLARAERFPEAERVMVLGGGEPPAVRAMDAVVLMTHSFEQDRELLAAVLPMAPRYLGLLGARHRSSLLLMAAAETLGWPLERCCRAVHAPVGLDLGGDGPEAVALAVVAEVQACCNGRGAAIRGLTVEEVGRQLVLHGGTNRYVQPQCAVGTV